MLCTNCGSDNPADAGFCEQCGRKLELLCPACKAPVSSGARFCKKCGAGLNAASSRSDLNTTQASPEESIRLFADQGTAEVPDGERKTVTALFADIKGSMELMEDLDPEEARAIVDPVLKLMMDAVPSLRRLRGAIDRRGYLRAVRGDGCARGPSATRLSSETSSRARCEADEKSKGSVPKYNISPWRNGVFTEAGCWPRQ